MAEDFDTGFSDGAFDDLQDADLLALEENQNVQQKASPLKDDSFLSEALLDDDNEMLDYRGPALDEVYETHNENVVGNSLIESASRMDASREPIINDHALPTPDPGRLTGIEAMQEQMEHVHGPLNLHSFSSNDYR